MSTRFKNNTNQLLLVPLNSGATIHLAPGEASDFIEEVETLHNERVLKLLRNRWLEALPAAVAPAAAPAKKRKS